VFTREFDAPEANDGGALAYDAFATQMQTYLGLVQPAASRRREPDKLSRFPSAQGLTTLRFAADLPDGRSMTVDMRLVGTSLDAEGPSFDEWYDGVTPLADIVLFNGHAGLGSNVRALMRKGSFRPGHYLVWFANGCDTLAYVDRTLADRRALLNPDDPGGTKYMDMVTNVMAGYFDDLAETAATFLRAFVEVRYPEIGPKTYEQIFEEIDPTQGVVVTGEEDNELRPLPPGHYPPGPPPTRTQPETEPPADDREQYEAAPEPAAERPRARNRGSCSSSGIGRSETRRGPWPLVTIGVLLVALASRRSNAIRS
jgi:hypothetical protein